MNKEFEIIIDRKVKERLNEFNMTEDMLGYINVFNNLKEKILKEEYNIILDRKKENVSFLDD